MSRTGTWAESAWIDTASILSFVDWSFGTGTSILASLWNRWCWTLSSEWWASNGRSSTSISPSQSLEIWPEWQSTPTSWSVFEAKLWVQFSCGSNTFCEDWRFEHKMIYHLMNWKHLVLFCGETKLTKCGFEKRTSRFFGKNEWCFQTTWANRPLWSWLDSVLLSWTCRMLPMHRRWRWPAVAVAVAPAGPVPIVVLHPLFLRHQCQKEERILWNLFSTNRWPCLNWSNWLVAECSSGRVFPCRRPCTCCSSSILTDDWTNWCTRYRCPLPPVLVLFHYHIDSNGTCEPVPGSRWFDSSNFEPLHWTCVPLFCCCAVQCSRQRTLFWVQWTDGGSNNKTGPRWTWQRTVPCWVARSLGTLFWWLCESRRRTNRPQTRPSWLLECIYEDIQWTSVWSQYSIGHSLFG